ncbi:MAG TPA: DUF763 domain-containing protein [Tepidisphaeraceae bacterium]|jgi:hypothetical protein|nr:DUF763 domain-containing protein [Tepidisphaeraceae bacterium]
MRRQMAQLPLHDGSAPRYLFDRMWRLAGAITMAVADEYGPAEMLRRLSDPWWFQAFGCVLGFDWHSSGVTTVTCGAMKEAYKHFGTDMGLHVAGGKGGTSRKTPSEIVHVADRFAISDGERLVTASKMSAKVDSAAVQDGYQLYHHAFFFTNDGNWCVVQQGMSDAQRSARRYHWLGETVEDFVNEPHHAIDDLNRSQHLAAGLVPRVPQPGEQLLLNMVAQEADANRQSSVDLIGWNPDKLLFEARRLTDGPTLFAPAHHEVLPEDVNIDRLEKVIRSAHEEDPGDFTTLLGSKGVGPATVRALSLLAELIYDAPASHRDPADASKRPESHQQRSWADYSYAHGGKDGTPHPVDRPTYDTSISVLTDAVRKARVGNSEKTDALKRLATFDRGPRFA